jgi:hypothetical protein
MKRIAMIKMVICLLSFICILAFSNIEINIEPTQSIETGPPTDKSNSVLITSDMEQSAAGEVNSSSDVQGKINQEIWITYDNQNIGYRLQHPQNCAIRENGPISFSQDEVPDGITPEEYLIWLTEELGTNICTTLEINNGYIAISAPVNKGNRYTICGPTGTPAGEMKFVEMMVNINGRQYPAKGTNVTGKSENDTTDMHSEVLWIELENGITIALGSIPDPNVEFPYYIQNIRPVLIQVLETFELAD